MNLRQMEVFRAVVREGSVTAAAISLGVSQPSVTEILKHTQDRLKMTLFERHGNRLQPTHEAHILFAEVEKVFERVASVNTLIDGLREGRVGSINIATIAALGLATVPNILGRFIADKPGLKSHISIKRRHQLTDFVQTQSFDLGIVYLNVADPRFDRHQLAKRGLLCLVPADHRLSRRDILTMEDLRDEPFISYTREQRTHAIVQNLADEGGVSLNPIIEIDYILQAWALVQAKAGVAVVDGFSNLAQNFPEVRAIPLDSKIELTLDAITYKSRPVSEITTKFIAHAKELIEELL